MSNTKKIIEINGVKMEVDLREAKVIDNFKVGDSVKLLIKDYNTYKSHPGVIVGFDNFTSLPTIVVAYISDTYHSADIKFAYINSETTGIEMCPSGTWDLPYTKEDVLSKMNREIHKKEVELKELVEKKNYFLNAFGKYFEDSCPDFEGLEELFN